MGHHHRIAAHSVSRLLGSSGRILFRDGRTSTAFSLVVGFLCLLGAIAFHLPLYPAAAKFLHVYPTESIRRILFCLLLLSGAIALANVLLDKRRQLNGIAFTLVIAAISLGGSRIPAGILPGPTPYVGLDWFLLDLLASTTVFVLLERWFPLYREQPIFRMDWQTDTAHFAVNHLIFGLMLLFMNHIMHRDLGRLANLRFEQTIQHIPFIPQLLLCMLVADLMQYVTHRTYHEIPFLWRFHAVHHSVKKMDWLAGSRQHFFELICTRVCVLGPLFILGFDKAVVDTYIIFVGFQAVFNHANVRLPWGPLKYVFVTPDFHHWHHSSDREAIDRNYALHFSFIDYLFGTAVTSSHTFPERYGVVDDDVPAGFFKQQAFPFRKY